MNKKLVVMTGSFNPVTRGHFKALSDTIKKLNADKGFFVATSNEYLINRTIVKSKKKYPFILSEDVRKRMIESLNRENDKLFFWGLELGGSSPTTDKTLKRIMKENPGYDLYYLCGADKLSSLPKWTNAADMFSRVYVVVYRRRDVDVDSIIDSDKFLNEHRDRIIVLDTSDDISSISSTELRRRFFAGLDYKELMNEGPYEIMRKFKPSDFKNPTAEEIIENTIMYGGRFGGNAARILVYKENLRLFKNWDDKRFGNLDSFIKGTKVYRDSFEVRSENDFETVFDCVNENCADVAFDLINDGYNPAILNLASNYCPCGGYDNGSNAQEESLCQMSTLSWSLYRYGNTKYKCVRETGVKENTFTYPMDINYGGIYTKDVTFFRNGLEGFYSLREEPFKCDVISVASLSNKISKYSYDDGKYFDGAGYLTDMGKEIERNKIRTIYRIGLDNGNDSLILGAFGCGVYNLNPDEVSRLFMDVLNEPEFKGKFKKIVFAIYEGKGSKRKVVGEEGKFKPFYETFSSAR